MKLILSKFLKAWEYQATLPASWEICMQVKKQQLELNTEQQTASKLGKEYMKAVYCHPAYLTYMQGSVQLLSHVWLFTSPWLQHTRLPGASPTPRACSNSCASSQWCHPTISSSVIPFSSCLQSFPTPGSFPMSQLFTLGGKSIGVPASASLLPMKIQGWLPLGLTGWISLQSKGLSGIVSNTAVQKHQFYSTQLSLYSSSHIHTWLLEKPQPWLDGPLLAK